MLMSLDFCPLQFHLDLFMKDISDLAYNKTYSNKIRIIGVLPFSKVKEFSRGWPASVTIIGQKIVKLKLANLRLGFKCIA